MISAELREQVRQRANFAYEFCGVSETDVGAKLTIDHFQPQSREGSDTAEASSRVRTLESVTVMIGHRKISACINCLLKSFETLESARLLFILM